MGASNRDSRRGPNSVVSLDLSEFTERFFDVCDCTAAFQGPGPVTLLRMGYRSPSERFALSYLAEEMFSKYDDKVASSAKRTKAVERFHQAESLCALTNQMLCGTTVGQPPWWMDDLQLNADEGLMTLSLVLRRAHRLISRVLGSFPGWDKVYENANFGPGATTRLPRKKGHHAYKWANCSHVTAAASNVLCGFLESNPGLVSALVGERPLFEIVEGNKLDWVAKNYKTDRTIAIEPDWNMFLQKGLGKLIRRKLKRVGIDLNDQTMNQMAAFIGSLSGELATIDLSMASDCVAYRLVEFLIRPDWFEALVALRSPVGFYTEDDCDQAVVFEKFSSMGNGYTFELETLIFWGLARAVSELTGEADHRLLVYGDDLVVPTGIAEEVIRILGQVGFMPNIGKTFLSGPFRESCGAHWFQGVDVKPFYVREAVDSIDRLFLLHNNVCRWFQQNPGIAPRDSVVEFLNWIRSHAPRKWRRPRLLNLESGDGGFYGNFSEVLPRRPGIRKNGWDGWITDILLHRSKHAEHQTKRHKVRAADGTVTEEKTRPWPLLSNPDYASIWRQGQRWNGERMWYRDRVPLHLLSSLGGGILKEISNLQDSPGDVPYRERYWYEGIHITPSHAVESAWWD